MTWKNLADLKAADFPELEPANLNKKSEGKKPKPLSSAEYIVKHGAEAWTLERERRREENLANELGAGSTKSGVALTRKFQDTLAEHIKADSFEPRTAKVWPVLVRITDLEVKLLNLGITVAGGSTLGCDKTGAKNYRDVALWLGRHIHQDMKDVALTLSLGAWGVRMLCKLPFFTLDENDVLILQYPEPLRDWLDDLYARNAAGRPYLLPSREPPEPWTQYRQGDLRLVTGRYSEAAVTDAIERGTMPTVLEAVNSLQRVPFTINKDVLAIAVRRSIAIPPVPAKTLTAKDSILQKQRRASARAKARNYQADMVLAEAIAGWNQFYNRVKLDSRGRAYPISHFSYQLSDHVRGIYYFADPKPTVTVTTGILSAFLVNDAVCLVMAPLVIELTRSLKRNPIPYLLAVAMASNVGSTATITGNPQNMIIAAVSHIPYTVFAATLTPVAGAGLLVVLLLLAVLWWTEFHWSARLTAKPSPPRPHKPQLIKAVSVALGVIIAFFVGVPVAKAAILGGALLLITRAVKAHKVYREIDGSLLLMFAGLFVVVAAAEKILFTPEVVGAVQSLHLDNVYILTAVSAVLSNIISNVPAVLALKPFVQGLADQNRIWLVIAMSATLAGNLTPVGSVANLIVAERARAAGIPISFWTYCCAGIPLTLITLAIGAWWLS